MINVSEETKNSFSPRENMMYRALEIAGRMLRKNPMGDIGEYPADLIRVLPGGEERDPEGKEYVSYFLGCAVKELRNEGKL